MSQESHGSARMSSPISRFVSESFPSVVHDIRFVRVMIMLPDAVEGIVTAFTLPVHAFHGSMPYRGSVVPGDFIACLEASVAAREVVSRHVI